MPAPALASSSGPSDGLSTKSPAGADVQQIAVPQRVVQVGGHTAVRRAVRPTHPTHSDLQTGAEGRGRHRVLAGLAVPVRKVDEDRDVLAGPDLRQLAAVGRLQDQGDDVGRLLDPADHPVRAHSVCRVGADPFIEPGFQRDQLGGEQPVDLAPRVGDLRGDRGAQYVGDRAQQVVADNGVLLGPDAERNMLVGNTCHDVIERGRGRVDQLDGVGDHGTGQRLALLSGGLVALVEHPEQLRVLGEHPRVEACGDLLGMLGHHGGSGLDDGLGSGGQQRVTGGCHSDNYGPIPAARHGRCGHLDQGGRSRDPT